MFETVSRGEIRKQDQHQRLIERAVNAQEKRDSVARKLAFGSTAVAVNQLEQHAETAAKALSALHDWEELHISTDDRHVMAQSLAAQTTSGRNRKSSHTTVAGVGMSAAATQIQDHLIGAGGRLVVFDKGYTTFDPLRHVPDEH